MSSKKSPTKNGRNSQKNKQKSKSKPKPKPKASSKPIKQSKSSISNNPNSFVYGFKIHSLSQVNQRNASKQSNKKNKKNSPTKNRNKQQPQSSPFSTASSSSLSIELYTSSVTKLLDEYHLNASSATSLHDLQCGTATIALQAFLTHPNLRRVFGIEQNKNLFHWATQNLLALIKNGYQNNKYLLVEQIPSNKMTIAQKASKADLESQEFKVGQVVYCYIPLKQNNIKKRDNYQGIIRSCADDGRHFDVEMSATKKVVKNVHKESIFKPGTERTFEICRGNLFERSDSFRSDIILLPYSISNDSFRSLLLTGCKRSPIGTRILSFSHLESWDGFPVQQLRRVDANVYDNDRYDSNLSPYHKLYLYSHVLSPSQGSPPKEVLALAIGSEITVRERGNSDASVQWFPGRVVDKRETDKTITIRKDRFLSVDNRDMEEMKIDEQRIHIIKRKFKIGDLICLYCPKMIETNHDDLYTLYRGQIMACHNNGLYAVQFEDGETHPKVYEIYIFNRNYQQKYDEGDVLYAYRYDKIKEFDSDGELVNIKQNKKKVEKQQCIVRHINADGTYRVEFIGVNQYYLHDSFCELWLSPLRPSPNNKTDEKKDEEKELDLDLELYNNEIKLPLIFEIDYDKVLLWKPNMVAHWMCKCGVSQQAANVLCENNVNGVFLFELDAGLLQNDMDMNTRDSQRILAYMRHLRHKLRLHVVDENDEEISNIKTEMTKYNLAIEHVRKEQEIIQRRLEKLIKSNSDEYHKYKEWELKLQCLALSSKKVSKKDIASQLKKNQTWVKKTCKLKANQIKKPGGNIIKQFEICQNQILKCKKHLKEKQGQLFNAKQKLLQFMDNN